MTTEQAIDRRFDPRSPAAGAFLVTSLDKDAIDAIGAIAGDLVVGWGFSFSTAKVETLRIGSPLTAAERAALVRHVDRCRAWFKQ